MQTEMPFIGSTKTPQLVADSLIMKCRHRLDAIRLCIQLSDHTHEWLAESMGIDKGHFSRIMQGKAWFPDTKSIQLMSLCGNYAPLQYEAYEMGFKLFKDAVAQRKEELLRELAELDAPSALPKQLQAQQAAA
jgi:hypothetical protein